jgi:hypothetical protein
MRDKQRYRCKACGLTFTDTGSVSVIGQARFASSSPSTAGVTLLFVIGASPSQASVRKGRRASLRCVLVRTTEPAASPTRRPGGDDPGDASSVPLPIRDAQPGTVVASSPGRNIVPSSQSRCSTTASLRATATRARRAPTRSAKLIAQAFSREA